MNGPKNHAARAAAWFFIVGASVAALLSPGQAFAQGAAAEALFNEGLAAKDKGDFATCATRLRESDRLDPAVGTKLNLAQCEQERGKLATAWDLFRGIADTAEASDPRRALAKKSAAALNPRVPHVTLRLAAGAPRGTTVRLGDAEFGAASFGVALPVDPGEHELKVSAPGHEDTVVQFEIGEGEREEIEIAPGAARSGDDTPKGGDEEPATAQASAAVAGGRSKPVGYLLGGIGIVGLGVGATTGIMAIGKKGVANDNCDDRLRICTQEGKDADSSGRTLAGISTIGFVVGVVGVGAGVYFLLTSGGDSKQEAALRARIGPESAAVTFLRSF